MTISLLKELRTAALAQPDAEIRADMQLAANNLAVAINTFAAAVTMDSLSQVNSAWAHCSRLLRTAPRPDDAPAGGRMRIAA